MWWPWIVGGGVRISGGVSRYEGNGAGSAHRDFAAEVSVVLAMSEVVVSQDGDGGMQGSAQRFVRNGFKVVVVVVLVVVSFVVVEVGVVGVKVVLMPMVLAMLEVVVS